MQDSQVKYTFKFCCNLLQLKLNLSKQNQNVELEQQTNNNDDDDDIIIIEQNSPIFDETISNINIQSNQNSFIDSTPMPFFDNDSTQLNELNEPPPNILHPPQIPIKKVIFKSLSAYSTNFQSRKN